MLTVIDETGAHPEPLLTCHILAHVMSAMDYGFRHRLGRGTLMTRKRIQSPTLKVLPLTLERWEDFEQLFGPRGACAGCWCMFWRLSRAVFDQQKGEGNKEAMKRLVSAGVIPGLLGYQGNNVVAWCSVAPRPEYPALKRSRNLQPVDDEQVWSISCLFVAKGNRKQGLSVALLQSVIEHVRQQGGRIVEGYPVEPKAGEMPAAFVWTGLASAFLQAGFREVARRSETRPIMRYVL